MPASSSCTFVPSPPSTSTPPIATPPTSRSQTIQNVPGSNALNLHNSLACLILGNTTSPTPGSPPRASLIAGSTQQLPNHLPINIRQPEIPPGIPVNQLLMVDAQHMQQRRVQVVNRNAI